MAVWFRNHWNKYIERLEKTDRKTHTDNLKKFKGKPLK